ncbi:MAG: divalent metal cation transporter [Phycisphaerales bacterium]|nr:divalent metal cation transporter [Phycisphaerales bacterium]
MDGERAARRAGLWKALGPGIVYAGAAIGVSHLVQSTRAGATYGFTLLSIVVLVNLFKYPFFEFGHRYPAATGNCMLKGYRRVGNWALIVFLVISFGTGMPTVAAVTLLSAGLSANLFPLGISVTWWAIILVAFTLALLSAGGYPWLDGLMKLMMVFLAVSTVIAVVAACFHRFEHVPDFTPPSIWTVVGVAFTIELMGWMPTPVDISAWPSLWREERAKQTHHKCTLREALFDFNLGYIATTVMAVLFLSLGALVMYGRGVSLERGAAGFAEQLVNMYTQALGTWSRPFILTAALTCMLSTTMTVIDGYPRVLAAGLREFGVIPEARERATYWVFNIALCVGALIIIACFAAKMLSLVWFVTTVAFLSAPLLAYINHATMFTPDVPPDAMPPVWMRWLSRAGIVFLLAFSGLYLWKMCE